jgi:hypothetical protein
VTNDFVRFFSFLVMHTAIDWSNLKVDVDKQTYFLNVLEKNKTANAQQIGME